MTWLQALFLFIPFAVLWNFLRRRKPISFEGETNNVSSPIPVFYGPLGYLKALLAWIFLFSRTFMVRPGLYYTGSNDPEVPLLVTGNFYLTIFLLVRRLRQYNVRLLVINTEGINVWCSAGKGKFSAREIISKARDCDLLEENKKLKLILPKLSLSGVNLVELRRAGINPVIGPVYAKDVPEFLNSGKITDRSYDRIRFGIKHRTFTALPSAVQFLFYFLGIYVISFGWLEQSIVWIATVLAFIYPILFPYLPGKLFAVKGISLGTAAAWLVLIFSLISDPGDLISNLYLLAFILATSILVGLSYTGNSPISNYTLVRKEIAKFLPVLLVIYVISLVLYVLL